MPNGPWTPGAWLSALTIAVLLAAAAAPVAAAPSTLVVAKDGLGSPKDCAPPPRLPSNEAPVGILKSGTGNVFAGNRFFNTPTPDPVAGPAGSRASPQR